MREQKAKKILDSIGKVIMGKDEVISLSLLTLLSRGHLLLEDVPGVGKTTLAKTLAATLGCGFSRVQFTPDTLPSDITGVSVYHMEKGEFEYVPGAIMNNIVLADEINRTSPKTQSSLLEAMEEGQVSVDGKTYPLPSPFMVIATQNPVDYLGTYHLPEAQMDRFLMKLSVGYPSGKDEMRMVKAFLEDESWKKVEAVTDAAEIMEMQRCVEQIFVHDDVVSYALEIIDKTRKNEMITLGASPRASLALLRAAQAKAYVEGRDFVTPDDIIYLQKPVLSHRLVLSPEASINRTGADKVLASIRCSVRVPVL